MEGSRKKIEDYAFISSGKSGALVAKNGSIDWLCLPRFDSEACFSALLGDENNGHWSITPVDELVSIERRYIGNSKVLETIFKTVKGTVSLTDFMPTHGNETRIVRMIKIISGKVSMRMNLRFRFDYGSITPWVQLSECKAKVVSGPNAVTVVGSVPLCGSNKCITSDFEIRSGRSVSITLAWHPSHEPTTYTEQPDDCLKKTLDWWESWSSNCRYDGPWKKEVLRSIVTLKSLIYRDTGGIVAAPTTSLPESTYGGLNWDYRFCWIRDATFILYTLLSVGYTHEAKKWRDWLLRAVAGSPKELQMVYGLHGERRLHEWHATWLRGFNGSQPVRIGNVAIEQTQWGVYGEILNLLHEARNVGISAKEEGQELELILAKYILSHWHQPDHGIWEIRGNPQQFVHSKVMCWVTLDRAIRSIEDCQRNFGSLAKLKSARSKIKNDVLKNGYNPKIKSFTQTYNSTELDASLLMLPLVGFLDPNDERVLNTVKAVEKELMQDGFVWRYRSSNPNCNYYEAEGAFIVCSFWYIDNIILQGRKAEAVELFNHILSVANDVGLLSEEYDPSSKRLLGNFPQAYSHVGIVNTALRLEESTASPKR